MSRRFRFRCAGEALRCVGLLTFLTGAGLDAEEPAEPTRLFDLEWKAPNTCPDASQVEARILEHLGREGIQPGYEAVLVVRATIRRVDGRHELALEIVTAAGSMTSEAGDDMCDALAELVAIKSSLALNPVETARQLLPREEPEEPTPKAPPVQEPEPLPPREEFPALVFHVAPLVGGGTLPSVEAGGFFALGVTGPVWQITFGASSASGPPKDVPEPRDGRVGMVLVIGSVTACVLPTAGTVSFPACLGVDAGAVHGRGIDLATDRAAWSPVIGGAVETGLTWPQDRNIRLLVRARARAHALRPSFSVTGLGEVHRAGVVGGQVLVGMEAVLHRRRGASR